MADRPGIRSKELLPEKVVVHRARWRKLPRETNGANHSLRKTLRKILRNPPRKPPARTSRKARIFGRRGRGERGEIFGGNDENDENVEDIVYADDIESGDCWSLLPGGLYDGEEEEARGFAPGCDAQSTVDCLCSRALRSK